MITLQSNRLNISVPFLNIVTLATIQLKYRGIVVYCSSNLLFVVTELESLLADYKREKELDTKQHHFESKASFDGLSDEDKPRNPNRLNLEQLGTRDFDLPQKKSSITPERNTKRRLEDFKRVVRKEEKLTDEIRDAKEKKEVKEKKAQDSEGLGSIMRDESKPRLPSKLEKLDASDTALPAKRTSLKSELNPKHQLADFKRVAKKEEELTREIPDAKEKKEAKEKKAEDPEDLGVIMRDEKKPKISSKLDKSDTALPAKRTSLASEPRAAHKLADFKRVAKKEKESAKEKHENKEKPKDKTPGIVVKPKPFENAEELEEQAQKVMKFLESHPCPSPEGTYLTRSSSVQILTLLYSFALVTEDRSHIYITPF